MASASNSDTEVITGPLEDENQKRIEVWKWILKRHGWKLLFFVVFMFFNIYAVLFVTGFVGNHPKGEDDKYELEKRIYEPCQFLDSTTLEGAEGDVDDKDQLKLKQILIVARHGDRYNFAKFAGEKSVECDKMSDLERSQMELYKTTSKSMNLTGFLDLDDALKSLPAMPAEEACEHGGLTPRGALQHLRLGKYIRSKYEKTSLLDQTPFLINVTTSPKGRTFSSMLAFLTGLLEGFDVEKLALPISVKASDSYSGCTDEFCACPNLLNVQTLLCKEMFGLYRMQNDSPRRNLVDYLAKNNSDFNDARELYDIIENSYSQFICRKIPLPCDQEHCLDFEAIDELVDYHAKGSGELFTTDFGVYRKFRALISFPILSYLKNQLQTGKAHLQLFLSHDIVIDSILIVLGANFVKPPQYAARIVFETYQRASDNQLLVRVLYNGIDRTREIRFCKNLEPNGFCHSSHFVNFIDDEIFKLTGAQNFTELCSFP